MSDRFETPSWENVPREPNAGDAEDKEPPAVAVEPPDLDASSENFLADWPVADAIPIHAPEEPDGAGQEVAETQAPAPGAADAEVAAPVADGQGAEPNQEPPAVLSDHVSATMEHAAGELTVPPGYAVVEGTPTGERRAVGVVVARFNGDVTTQLLQSALAELAARGVSRDAVTVMPVPGAFELPLAAMALAKTRRFACIVALGCVIRGDTPHFDYVSSEAASGLQLAAIETGVPVAFGGLPLDRADQAASRVEKGAEAVRTGLEMADLFANLRAAAAR